MVLYLGAPLWANKAWVGSFFPAGTPNRDFLALYSRRLNTVEGNTTFYAVPAPETVDRWREDTPEDFRFCFKFPRRISHELRLRSAEAETAVFYDRLAQLGSRAGPAFLQLPPTFGQAGLPALEEYLDLAARLAEQRGIAQRVAVEVRHADFFGPAEAALDGLLRERGAGRVLYDVRGLRSVQGDPPDAATREALARKPDVPVRFTRTAPFAFVRYIAHPDVGANGPWFAEWAEHVARWLQAGDDVFFFCHNRRDVLAPQVAREFHNHLAARIEVPPLPAWEACEPRQGSFF